MREENITDAKVEAPKRGVPTWVQIVIWVILVGLLVLVGTRLQRVQQGTVQPGQPIENFKMSLFEGYSYEGQDAIALADLRGKVVVINFWASWCKPCEQEAATLQSAWKEYENDGRVIFLGADYVDTPTEASLYLQKFNITYPNGEDRDLEHGRPLSQYFRITGVPETYFIDQEGVLRFVHIGPLLSVEQLRSQIDPLLSE